MLSNRCKVEAEDRTYRCKRRRREDIKVGVDNLRKGRGNPSISSGVSRGGSWWRALSEAASGDGVLYEIPEQSLSPAVTCQIISFCNRRQNELLHEHWFCIQQSRVE